MAETVREKLRRLHWAVDQHVPALRNLHNRGGPVFLAREVLSNDSRYFHVVGLVSKWIARQALDA